MNAILVTPEDSAKALQELAAMDAPAFDPRMLPWVDSFVECSCGRRHWGKATAADGDYVIRCPCGETISATATATIEVA